MKTRHLLFIPIAALSLAACTSPSAPAGYTLTGQIEGLPDGTHVQLVPVSHERTQPIADTTVVGGQFTFTGTADEPLAVLLMVKDAYGSRRLMLENAAIDVSGRVEADSAGGSLNYDLEALSVTGSPLSARYDSLMSIRERMGELYESNAEKHKDIHQALTAARQAKDTKKLAELQASEAYKAMAADEAAFFHTVDSLSRKAVMDNKDSFWGPLMLISLTTYLTDDQKPWYEAFSDEAKASRYGQMVKDELYPVGKTGTTVPDFKVKDADGQEVTLASLREGKKYVLIDFWASWCGPCRREIPNLKEQYKNYADKGFDIVSISIDKKKADWEKTLQEEQLPWHNFLDDGSVADLYKVSSIPAMYLIDAEGVMVGENLRGEALAKKLAELLK